MPVVRRTISETREDTQELTHRLATGWNSCDQTVVFRVLDYYKTAPWEQYAPPELLGTAKPTALVTSMSQDPANPVGWFMRPAVLNLLYEETVRALHFTIGTWPSGSTNVPAVQTALNSYPCDSTTYPYTQPLIFYYSINYPRWEYRYSKVGDTEYYDQIDLTFKLKLTVLPFVQESTSGTFTYKTAAGTSVAKVGNITTFPTTELALNASNNWQATLGTINSTSDHIIRNIDIRRGSGGNTEVYYFADGTGNGVDVTYGGGSRHIFPYFKYSTNQVILNFRTFHGNTQVPLVRAHDGDHLAEAFNPYTFRWGDLVYTHDGVFSRSWLQVLMGDIIVTVGAPTYEIPNYPKSFKITSNARTELNNATFRGVYTLLPTTGSGRDLKKSFPLYQNKATGATILAQGGYQRYSIQSQGWLQPDAGSISAHSYLQLGPIWNDPTAGIELIFDKIPKISTGQIFNFIVGKYDEVYIRVDEFGDSWSVVGGTSLLVGLAIDGNGKLFGVPTKTTNASIEIRISNSVGNSTTAIQLIVTDEKRAQLQGNDLFKAVLFEGINKAPALLYGKPYSYHSLLPLPATLTMQSGTGTIQGSLTGYPSTVEPPDSLGVAYVDRLSDGYTSKWEFSKIPESGFSLNSWNIVKGTDLIGAKFAGGSAGSAYRRNPDRSLEILDGWMRVPKGPYSGTPTRTYAMWVQLQNDTILLSQYSTATGRRLRMLSVEKGKLVARASVYDPRYGQNSSTDEGVDYYTGTRSHVIDSLELLNRWVFIVYQVQANGSAALSINGVNTLYMSPRLPGVVSAASTNFSTYTTDGLEDLFYPHEEYGNQSSGGKIAFFARTVGFNWSEREIVNVYLRTHPTKSYPDVGSKKYTLIFAASKNYPSDLCLNDSREPIFFEGVAPPPSNITVDSTMNFGEGLPFTIAHKASCQLCWYHGVDIAVTWKVKNLPVGLNFNTTTGVITGSLGCNSGLSGWLETTTYKYQITAENAQGSYTQEMQISIYPRPVVGPLDATITGKVGEEVWHQWSLVPDIYTNPKQRPIASGGWSISEPGNNGSLATSKCGQPCGNSPYVLSSMNEGLCFSNCGILNGTAQKILNNYAVQIKVKNDLEHWSAPVTAILNISAGVPSFSIAEGTEYQLRTAVDFTLQIPLINSLNRPVTSWSAAALPPGLSISSAGVITGKPSTTITNNALYRATITATGPGGSASLTLNFKVQASLTDDSTVQLYWGDPLTPIKVAAEGLQGVNAWDTEGLTTGLVFNTTTLELSGTPTWNQSYANWNPWRSPYPPTAKLIPKTVTQVPAVIKDIGYGCGVLHIAYSDTKVYIDPIPTGIAISSPWVAPAGEKITGAAGNADFICISTDKQTRWFLKSGATPLPAEFPTREKFLYGTERGQFNANMSESNVWYGADQRYIRYDYSFYGWNPVWGKKSSQVHYSATSQALVEQRAFDIGYGMAVAFTPLSGGGWKWEKVGPGTLSSSGITRLNNYVKRLNDEWTDYYWLSQGKIVVNNQIKNISYMCALQFGGVDSGAFSGGYGGGGGEGWWNPGQLPTHAPAAIFLDGGVWDSSVTKETYRTYRNHYYQNTYTGAGGLPGISSYCGLQGYATATYKGLYYLTKLIIDRLIYVSVSPDTGKIAFVDIFGYLNVFGGSDQKYLDRPLYNCGPPGACNNTVSGKSIYVASSSGPGVTPIKIDGRQTPQWVNGKVFYRPDGSSQARTFPGGNVFNDPVTVAGQAIDITFTLNHGKPLTQSWPNLQVVLTEHVNWRPEYTGEGAMFRAPSTWTAVGLPTGLAMNSATGLFTGRLDSHLPAPVSVQITASNQAGSATWSITVSTVERVNLVQLKYPEQSAGAWDNRIYMEGQWGEPWTAQFTKISVPGWENLTWSWQDWSMVQPGIPPGLSINPITGVISGTPTEITRWERASPGTGLLADRPIYSYVGVGAFRTNPDGTTLGGRGCFLEIFIKAGKPKFLDTWDRKISFNLEGGDQLFNFWPFLAERQYRTVSSFTLKSAATGADISPNQWARTYGTDICTHIGKQNLGFVANPVYPLNATTPAAPHKFILTAVGPGGSASVEVFISINPITEVAGAPKLSGVLPVDSVGREAGPCAGVVQESSSTPGASAPPVNYAYYWFGLRLAELHKASTSSAILDSNRSWLATSNPTSGCGKANVIELEFLLGEERTFSFLPYWFFVAMNPVKQTSGAYNGTYDPQAVVSISGWPIPLRRAEGDPVPAGMVLNMWWLSGAPTVEGEFKFSLTVDTERYAWLYKNISLTYDTWRDGQSSWSSLGKPVGTYWSRVAHRYYGDSSSVPYAKLSVRPTLIRSSVSSPISSSPKTYHTPQPMAFDLPWIHPGSNSGEFIQGPPQGSWPVGDFKKAELSNLTYTRVKYPVEQWINPNPYPTFANLTNPLTPNIPVWLNDYDKHFPYAMAASSYAAEQSKENAAQQAFSSVVTGSGSPISADFKTPEVLIRVVALPKIPATASIKILLNRETDITVPLEYESARSKLTFFDIAFGSTVSPKLQVDKFGKITGKTQDLEMLTQSSNVRAVTMKAMIAGSERTVSGQLTISYAYPPPLLEPTTLYGAKEEDFFGVVSLFDPEYGTATFWKIVSGSLPAGLKLNPDRGFITGIPEVHGIYTCTVTATGPGGDGNIVTLTLGIAKSIKKITPGQKMTLKAGSPFRFNLATTRGEADDYLTVANDTPSLGENAPRSATGGMMSMQQLITSWHVPNSVPTILEGTPYFTTKASTFGTLPDASAIIRYAPKFSYTWAPIGIVGTRFLTYNLASTIASTSTERLSWQKIVQSTTQWVKFYGYSLAENVPQGIFPQGVISVGSVAVVAGCLHITNSGSTISGGVLGWSTDGGRTWRADPQADYAGIPQGIYAGITLPGTKTVLIFGYNSSNTGVADLVPVTPTVKGAFTGYHLVNGWKPRGHPIIVKIANKSVIAIIVEGQTAATQSTLSIYQDLSAAAIASLGSAQLTTARTILLFDTTQTVSKTSSTSQWRDIRAYFGDSSVHSNIWITALASNNDEVLPVGADRPPRKLVAIGTKPNFNANLTLSRQGVEPVVGGKALLVTYDRLLITTAVRETSIESEKAIHTALVQLNPNFEAPVASGIGAGESIVITNTNRGNPWYDVQTSTGTLRVDLNITEPVSKIIAGSVSQKGYVDGPASTARFNGIHGVVEDQSGNLYVTDRYNNKIRKISNWRGAAATVSTFASVEDPKGITLNAFGEFFVTAKHAIYKISATGVVTLWIGNPNEPGYVRAAGTAARLNDPQGIVAVTEEFVIPDERWAALGVRAGTTPETYKGYTMIYFLDSGNQRLRRFFNYSNSPVTTLGLNSEGPLRMLNADSSFNCIVRDPVTDDLYVSTGRRGGGVGSPTTYEHSIYKITSKGVMSLFAGAGEPPASHPENYCGGYSTGQGTSARFTWISGMHFGSDGNLYVMSDCCKLSKISTAGQVTEVSIIPPYAFPVSIEVWCWGAGNGRFVRDTNGNFFVANAHGIWKIASNGALSLYAGSDDIVGGGGFSNGDRSLAKFRSISAIAIDGGNNLYVADSGNNRIRKISSSGYVTAIAGPIVQGEYFQPTHLSAMANGTLFIAANNRIFRLAAGSTTPTGFAGTGYSGFRDGMSPFFSGIQGISVNGDGTAVYVLDQSGQMIRIASTSASTGGYASTMSGYCDNCTSKEYLFPNCTALTYGYEWRAQDKGRLVLYAGGNSSTQADTFKVFQRDSLNGLSNQGAFTAGDFSGSGQGFGDENHKIVSLFHAPRTASDPRTGITQLYATTETGKILKLKISDSYVVAASWMQNTTQKVSYLLPGEIPNIAPEHRDWAYLYDTAVTPQSLDTSLDWPFTLPERIALPATSYDNRWAYLAYGAGKFIAIQDYSSEAAIKDTDEFSEMSGAGKGAWSEDGRDWTSFDLPNTPKGYSLGPISFINDAFFLIMQRVHANPLHSIQGLPALENKLARVLTSADGTTWDVNPPFYVRMAFRNSGAVGQYQNVALTVDYGPPKPLTIEKLFLEAGKNYAFSELISFEDRSFRPVTSWKITGLPAGLTYAQFAPGKLSGQINSPGNHAVTLELFNSAGSTKSAISIVILPVSPVITPGQSFTVLAGDYQGEAGEVASPAGQYSKTNFSISPKLARTYPGQEITWKTAATSPTEVFPAGITIDSSTGKISGKLSKVGTYTLRIAAVTEGAPQKSELITLVVAPGLPVILPGQVWKYTAGTQLNYTDPNIAVRLTDPANMLTSFSFKISGAEADSTDTGYQATVSDYVISANGTQTVYGRTLPKGSIIKGKYTSTTPGYVTTENEATEIELTIATQVGDFSLYESAKIIWTYGPPVIASGQEVWGEVGVPMLVRPVQKTEATYTVGAPTFAAGKKNFSGEIFLAASGSATIPTPAEYFRTLSEIIRNSYDISTKTYVSGTSKQSLPSRDSGLEVGLRYFENLKFPALQYWGALTGTPNTILNTKVTLIAGNYAGERPADVNLIILGGQPRIKADQKFAAFAGEATELTIVTEDRFNRPITSISLYVGYESPNTFPAPDASPGTNGLNGLALVIENGLIKLKGTPVGGLAESRIVLRAVGQNTYAEAAQASSEFGKLGWGSIKLEIFNNLPRARTDIVYTVEAGVPADIILQADPLYGAACLWRLTSAGQDLSLVGDNLKGTVRAVGTYTYTVKAGTCSGYYGPETAITVQAVLAKPELQANQTMKATQQATAGYTLQLTKSRSVLGQLTWSSENLPAGLNINSQGVIVGSVSTYGKFTASVTVSNEAGTDTDVINIEIAPGAILFTIPDMQMWEGEDFNAVLTVTRGAAVRWWVGANNFATFLLPTGIALSEAGTISGKPSKLGVYWPRVFARGVEGSEYSVTPKITVSSRISIGKDQIFRGILAQPVSFQVFYLNKSSLTITAFTASGLPGGLSMSATGAITGTPSETGIKTVEITIATADSETKENITIHIIAGKPSLPAVLEYTGKVGEALNIEILAENITERPVTDWAVLDLPTYLTANNNIITGTAKFKSTIFATARAANFAGITSASIKITITDGVPIVPLGQSLAIYTGINSYVVAEDPVNRSVTLWQASDLPTGVVLNGSTGQISGTLENDTTIYVTATGPGGTSSPTPVQLMKVSNVVNVFKYVENNTAIYVDSFESLIAVRYSIGTYLLPKSLNLNTSTGYITGFTTATASSFVKLEITRENGSIETHNTAIVPIDAPPKIEAGQTKYYLLGRTVNDPTLLFTGLGVTFSSLNLPEGLQIDQSSGKFYGTPAKTGTFKSTIIAQNVGGEDTEEITFVIEADFLPPILTPYEKTITLRRNSYIQPILVQNTGGPIEQWQVSELPEGLVFNSAAREFKGKPTTLGDYSIDITATNALGASSVTLSLSVLTEIKRPVIQSDLMFTLYKDTPWTDKIVLLEGEATRFSALDPLPAGLSLNADTGGISGTATSVGTHIVAVAAENTEFTSEPVVLTIQILSNRASLVPQIATNQNFEFYTGETKSVNIELDSMQGVADLWAIATGTLPQGLMLDSGTGKIYGSATVTGTYTLSVQAENKIGVSSPATITISVLLSLKAPVLAENQNFQLVQNTEALISLVSTNEATEWGLPTGESLPEALSISTSTGTITGKAETLGVHIFKAYVRNTYGYSEQSIQITIVPQAPELVENQEVQGVVGTALNYAVKLFKGLATGWSYSGSLPAAISLSASGEITGTPTESFSGTITVTALNISGSSSKTLKLTILNSLKLEIEPNQRFYAKVGTPFNATIKNSGITPQLWENLNTLPAGLSLNKTTGNLSGTPSTAGTTTTNIKISHTTYPSYTAGITIDVLSANAALRVVTSQIFSYSAASVFNFTPAVIGSPTTWETKGLPAGTVINSLTGEISGSIAALGNYSFTLIVRSGASAATGTIKLKIT